MEHDLKIFSETVEPQALNQVYTLMKQPAFQGCKVRIMPDVHAGVGCVIGFTADLGDKIIPNVVGVDIGCGMLTVALGPVDLSDALLFELDKLINENIPAGRNVHSGERYFSGISSLRCFRNLRNVKWLHSSMGTLGGGNHFIEVDADDQGNKYLIIHTGSRNLGKQVAEIYQDIAVRNVRSMKLEKDKMIAELKAAGREQEIHDALAALSDKTAIPKDLCYLEGAAADDYLHDMRICQHFAQLNRENIARIICNGMGWVPLDHFHTIHNYIDDEGMVRKGAISAHAGEIVLIPINMRDGCIIGRGRGNPDWNESAPHGAGRLMSRSKAKTDISMEEYLASMDGIYTTSIDRSTLDEAPQAYKPMQEILDAITDTVDVLKIIKPIYSFKAGD